MATDGIARPGGRFKDISGQRFGRVVVLNVAGVSDSRWNWLCRCDCGNETIVAGKLLRTGQTRSCGCLRSENAKRVSLEFTRRHGESTHGTRSAEYRVWISIKDRCFNKDSQHWKDYGGRGITMCEEWKDDFEAFLRYMGRRPSPAHSIERLRNGEGYSPSNCAWATHAEQQNNRRSNRVIEHQGQRLTIAQWVRETGLPRHVIVSRLQGGWEVEIALTTPHRPKRR
jgi:hypothetical protein